MKKIFLIVLFSLLSWKPVFAESIPVKIELNQQISTEIDNSFEVGDEIEFLVANDVYYNGNLLIKKNSSVYGVIDFIHDNGWIADGAEIEFKKFILKDVYNNKITVNFPMTINRQYNTVNKKKNLKSLTFLLLSVFRGNELNIESGSMSFNIIIDEP